MESNGRFTNTHANQCSPGLIHPSLSSSYSSFLLPLSPLLVHCYLVETLWIQQQSVSRNDKISWPPIGINSIKYTKGPSLLSMLSFPLFCCICKLVGSRVGGKVDSSSRLVRRVCLYNYIRIFKKGKFK